MPEISRQVFDEEARMMKLFLSMGPTLFEATRTALLGGTDSQYDVRPGFSYRMNVAAGFLAFTADLSDFEIVARGNVKPYEGSQKRLCAERIAHGAIKRSKFTRVAGGVLEGTGDSTVIKSVEDVESPTLLPCSKSCIPMLNHSPLIIGDIPIITRDDQGRKSQAFTLRQITHGYQEDPAILFGNTFAEANFGKALNELDRLVDHARNWTNLPSPAEMAVSCIVNTAR